MRGNSAARVFIYARVSTSDQTPSNQVQEVQRACFVVDPKRTICEVVSGSVPTSERPGFVRLLNKLEDGDVLVVTKLDRLGRNAMDVRSTVEKLAGMGVRVHCLALGGVDLTSAPGRMTMGVLTAVAEFERDLLIERTQAGLQRAKREGKTLGRPSSLSAAQVREVQQRTASGETVAALAKALGTSRQTVMRARDSKPAA